MKQRCGISLFPERRLAMTFCLQQALAILQMPQIELAQLIQEEIDKNPLLEETAKPLKPFLEKEVQAPSSLEECLQTQIRDNFLDPETRKLATRLLEYLDEKGFLSDSENQIAKELNLELPQLQSVIAILQTFKPTGIFARNLQESLLIQLKEKGEENSAAYKIVKDHYEDFKQGRFSFIRKKEGLQDFAEVIHHLTLLSLRPLEAFKYEAVSHVVPDMVFKCLENEWAIEMNDEILPRFQITQKYASMALDSKEEKKTVKAWLSQAKTLLHSLSRRKKILLKLGAFLAKYQSDYLFSKGYLKKLDLKDLSEKFQLHESTISRSLSNKYVETPRGIIPLNQLLSASPNTEKTKEILKRLIENESKSSPFTDEELAEKLQAQGHTISRRTISKYRKELKILSASMRKS